jgi:hypothetical protein
MARGRPGRVVGSVVFTACVVVAAVVVAAHRRHRPNSGQHRDGHGTAEPRSVGSSAVEAVVPLASRGGGRGPHDQDRLVPTSRPVAGSAAAALDVGVEAEDPVPSTSPDPGVRFGGLTLVPDLPARPTPSEAESTRDALEAPVPQVDESGLQHDGATSATSEVYEFTELHDDIGVLVVDVPTSWSDVETDPVVDNEGATYPQILAAPDAEVFLKGYLTPGMSLAVDPSGATGVDEWLSRSDLSADGVTDGVDEYDDGVYRGKAQVWYDCGVSNAQVAVVAAQPHDQAFTVRVVVQALTDADVEACERIIRTFRVATD